MVVPQPNTVWAVDFMSDTLYGGRRFWTLNILDEGVREGLAIEIDTSLPAERVIRVLEQVVSWRGQPKAIWLDNGPEFIAESFISWCTERAIQLWHIQPGKPDQNAFIERYNLTYRTEVLNAYVFETLDQVREISEEWLQSYNEERSMTRSRACRLLYIGPNSKPDILLLKCLLDRGAYGPRETLIWERLYFVYSGTSIILAPDILERMRNPLSYEGGSRKMLELNS